MKAINIKYKGETFGIEPIGGKRVRVYWIAPESWTTAKHDEIAQWCMDYPRHLPKKKAEKLVKDALES